MLLIVVVTLLSRYVNLCAVLSGILIMCVFRTVVEIRHTLKAGGSAIMVLMLVW